MSSDTVYGYTACAEELPSLSALQHAGIVEKVAHNQFASTDYGISGVQSVLQDTEQRSVLRLDDQRPLELATTYELVNMLSSHGWTWEKWIAPGQRTKKTAPIPLGYIAGADKIWYSTFEVHPTYLRCLLLSEELFQRGLTTVPHGKLERDYKRILSGKPLVEASSPV